VSGAMELCLGLGLGLDDKNVCWTLTYVKVSGGHFELEDTIKCYNITGLLTKVTRGMPELEQV